MPHFFRLGSHLKDAHEEEGDTSEAREVGRAPWWPQAMACSEVVASPLCILWQLSDSRKAGGVGYPAYSVEDDRVMCQRPPSRLMSELGVKQPCFQSLTGSMNKYPHASHGRDWGL